MGLAASGFSANAYTTLGAVLGMMVGGYLSDWVTKHGLHHRLLEEALWIGVCFPFPLFFVSPSRLFLIFLSIFTFGQGFNENENSRSRFTRRWGNLVDTTH